MKRMLISIFTDKLPADFSSRGKKVQRKFSELKLVPAPVQQVAYSLHSKPAAVRKRSQTAQGMVWSAVQNDGSVMHQRGLSANTAVKCEPGAVKGILK